MEIQREEFKQLGIMADWEGSAGVYRTLGLFIGVLLDGGVDCIFIADPQYEIRQLKIFQKMVERGRSTSSISLINLANP
jgi:isoleucyl-tRNA synthetase